MSFVGLILRNVTARKARSGLTAAAVAVGVATVVTLGVVTESMRATAGDVFRAGKSDFVIAQLGVSDVLDSIIDTRQLRTVSEVPGVTSAVGALGATFELDRRNPEFLVLGAPQDRLGEFGVRVVAGRGIEPGAGDEILLGRLASRRLDKRVGSHLRIDDRRYEVVGLFAAGEGTADAGAMLPLRQFQRDQHKVGLVTLVFVRVEHPSAIGAARRSIERASPQLVTVRFESEFGEADRNLALISAADDAGTIVALVVGAIVVMNAMLLSLLQRTRELGVLRAIGWSRRRVVALVMGEATLIGLAGALVGVGLSFVVGRVLEQLPSLVGVLDLGYSADAFWRGLAIAAAVVAVGALYPTLRAAFLRPLEALRRE